MDLPFYLGLVQSKVLGGLKSLSYSQSKVACHWKHMGLFTVPGFAVTAYCRAAVRVWYVMSNEVETRDPEIVYTLDCVKWPVYTLNLVYKS